MDYRTPAITMTAIVAGSLVLGLLGRLAGRRWAGGSWAIVVAVAAAVLAADKPLIGDPPQWRPSDVNWQDPVQRTVLSVAVAAVAALAVTAGGRRLRWAGGIAAAAVPAGLLVWVRSSYPPASTAGWPSHVIGPAAAASAVIWLLVEPLAVRRPTGIAAPWTCGCLLAGVGLLCLFSTATAPGWIATAASGVVLAAFGLSLARLGPSFAGGPVAVIAPLLAAAAAVNHVAGGEVSPASWAALLAAAAVAWVAEVPFVSRRPAYVREPLRMLLVAAVVTAAVVPAYHRFKAEQAAEMPQQPAGEPAW